MPIKQNSALLLQKQNEAMLQKQNNAMPQRKCELYVIKAKQLK